MDNIQRFNLTIAVILSKIYAEFPRQMTVHYGSIAKVMFEEHGVFDPDCPKARKSAEFVGIDPDSFHDARPENLFVRDTLYWLADHGFISGTAYGSYIDHCTLTPKGLALMGVAVEDGALSATIKEKSFGRTIAAGFGSAAKDQIADFMGKTLYGFVSAGS